MCKPLYRHASVVCFQCLHLFNEMRAESPLRPSLKVVRWGDHRQPRKNRKTSDMRRIMGNSETKRDYDSCIEAAQRQWWSAETVYAQYVWFHIMIDLRGCWWQSLSKAPGLDTAWLRWFLLVLQPVEPQLTEFFGGGQGGHFIHGGASQLSAQNGSILALA